MYLRVLFDMPSLSHGHGQANKTRLVHSQRAAELWVSFPPSGAVIRSVASSIVILALPIYRIVSGTCKCRLSLERVSSDVWAHTMKG